MGDVHRRAQIGLRRAQVDGKPRVAGGWLWGVERRFASHRWQGWSLATVERRCTTPPRVFDYMERCFDYVEDHLSHGVEEFWQTPEHTHALGTGDCEDWALFARHVLRRAGLDARAFAVFGACDGHATCLVPWRRRWHRLGTRGFYPLEVEAAGGEVAVAHAAAAAFYPEGWECCSYVERFGRGPGSAGGGRPLIPEYDWITPPRASPVVGFGEGE